MDKNTLESTRKVKELVESHLRYESVFFLYSIILPLGSLGYLVMVNNSSWDNLPILKAVLSITCVLTVLYSTYELVKLLKSDNRNFNYDSFGGHLDEVYTAVVNNIPKNAGDLESIQQQPSVIAAICDLREGQNVELTRVQLLFIFKSLDLRIKSIEREAKDMEKKFIMERGEQLFGSRKNTRDADKFNYCVDEKEVEDKWFTEQQVKEHCHGIKPR